MNELIVRNFRCFKERHTFEIAPLTILIGENSTGKTSLLAAKRLAYDASFGMTSPVFNEEPFNLGIFEDIVCNTVTDKKPPLSFSIGFSNDAENLKEITGIGKFAALAQFSEGKGIPTIKRWSLSSGKYKLTVSQLYNKKYRSLTIISPTGRINTRIDTEGYLPGSIWGLIFEIEYVLFRITKDNQIDIRNESYKVIKKSGDILDTDYNVFRSLLHVYREKVESRPYAMSPIRTNPERIYEPTTEKPKPTGDHIYQILAQKQKYEVNEWKKIKRSLERIGRSSGLFKEIRIERKGDKASDPFLISIIIDSSSRNIIDVGYGVSQILPILVEATIHPERRCLLLQQPEIHLHPRAQAALATYLCDLVANDNRHFMIETHSDYIIDRIRMDIRDSKGIESKDVVIHYLERQDGQLKRHTIKINKKGELIGAPTTYRSFFLKEESRFLGL